MIMTPSKGKTIHVIDFNKVEDHVEWINKNRFENQDKMLLSEKTIILDFSYAHFLKPYHIAPLACLIHEYKKNGFCILPSKARPETQSYLESFGFYEFCKSSEHDGFQVSNDKKTFPLWLIRKSRKDFYTIHVQKYYEDNHFGSQDLFVLGNSMAELMNNIFDHSNSKIPGYTFTQYNTRSNSIVTCVCDFGIGIPTSVNTYLRKNNNPILADDEALRKAFEQNFSALTKPHNRGFGWDTIFQSIIALKGKLHIVSNHALFLIHENGIITSQLMNLNFPGTLVFITLNTNNLPQKEEYSDELNLF